jgi:fido (protein-threonine AMPylation protein)
MGDHQLLTLRQKAMLIIIEQHSDGISRSSLEQSMQSGFPVSRATLIRDLNLLLGLGLVIVEGKGPATRYKARSTGQLLSYWDIQAYFTYEPDVRPLTEQGIDAFLEELASYRLFSDDEYAQLSAQNAGFQARLSTRTPDILRREQERFTIELAWKSSRIEGNTYSLLETEELLKTSKEAQGHDALEARMILNHKAALDAVLARREDFRKLTIDGVLHIHRELVNGLGINPGIRTQPVGITGTAYLPPDDPADIRRYLGTALQIANAKEHPVEAALIASALIACLQPFSDGNKRTARLVGNAVLLANGYAALSYRSVNEIAYKQAVLLIDEQHSLYWYKRLFVEQFQFACEKYFA